MNVNEPHIPQSDTSRQSLPGCWKPVSGLIKTIWDYSKIWWAQIFSIFIILLFVGKPHFTNNKLVNATPFKASSILFISLLATIFLIFWNTVAFLWENRKLRQVDIKAKNAFILTIISILLTVIWFFSITNTGDSFFIFNQALKFFYPHSEPWFSEKYGIELMSLLIFSIFFIIDYLFRLSIKNEQAEAVARGDQPTALKHLELSNNFIRDSLLFIDLPVLIGVFAILMLAVYIDDERGLHDLTDMGKTIFTIELVDRKPKYLQPIQLKFIFENFMHGFTTGAIIMHLASSQFVFGLLKTRDLYQRNMADSSSSGQPPVMLDAEDRASAASA